VLLLTAILLVGTIFAGLRSSDAGPVLRLGRSASNQSLYQKTELVDQNYINVFAGVGRLRIQLKNASILILSVSFPYHAEDWAFAEELAGKISDFRTIVSEYFAALPDEKLINLDETAAKDEILKRYNATLRLGRIEALYFHDLMIIDN
jgi:flagellar basal body-associated protein FliL